MTKQQKIIKNILAIVSALILLGALIDGWQYGYFQILRWVVAGSAVYTVYLAYNAEKNLWIWLMGAIAVLFNPIFPIHLARETWLVIDVIVAVVFAVSIFKFKIKEIKEIQDFIE